MGRISKSRINRQAGIAKSRLNGRKKADKIAELNLVSSSSSKIEKANETLRNNVEQKESKLQNKKTYSKMMHTSKRSIKDKCEKDIVLEELNRYKRISESLGEPKEHDEEVSEVMEFEPSANYVAPASNKSPKTCKRRKPANSGREFESLSQSGKKRRLSTVHKTMSENLPPTYRITNSPEKEPNIEESLNLLIDGNVPERTYQRIRNLSAKPVVSRYTIRKELQKLQRKYGEATEFKVGERLGLYFKPKPCIISRIKWKNQIVTKYQIVLSGDCGGNITKFCLFLPNATLSQSPFNISILGYVAGGDDYSSLMALLNYIGDDLGNISKNGIVIDGETQHLSLAVGDLKFIPTLMGLQGGTADCFCPWCYISRKEVETEGFRAEKRTLDELLLKAEQCEAELKTCKKSKIAGIRKKFGSVKGKPLIKFIKPEHFVPPPLHLLTELANSSIKYVTNVLKNKTLQDAIQQLNLNIHYPSQTLNGNESRKLLEKIRKREVIVEEPGLELFLAAADVEQYAVARILEEAEIDQLKICIASCP
uniref:Uncharacterized protein n=1 Tax=Panagrolaimus superbus TaxID=310955 RepID=A0A914YN67_9BILA